MAAELGQLPAKAEPGSENMRPAAFPGPDSAGQSAVEGLVNEPATMDEPPRVQVPGDHMPPRPSDMKSVHFAYGSAELSNSAREWISRHAERLRADAGLTVRLYGFADDFSSSSYSIALGALRAQVVRNQLLALKVSPSQIRITSYGHEKSSPTPCQTEACHEAYRRVEFRYEPRQHQR